MAGAIKYSRDLTIQKDDAKWSLNTLHDSGFITDDELDKAMEDLKGNKYGYPTALLAEAVIKLLKTAAKA